MSIENIGKLHLQTTQSWRRFLKFCLTWCVVSSGISYSSQKNNFLQIPIRLWLFSRFRLQTTLEEESPEAISRGLKGYGTSPRRDIGLWYLLSRSLFIMFGCDTSNFVPFLEKETFPSAILCSGFWCHWLEDSTYLSLPKDENESNHWRSWRHQNVIGTLAESFCSIPHCSCLHYSAPVRLKVCWVQTSDLEAVFRWTLNSFQVTVVELLFLKYYLKAKA